MENINLAEEQFSEAHDFPETDACSKVVIIASTSRCGSHMLGHALHATGCFGFPLEYAHPFRLPRWEERMGTKGLFETLRALQRRRTSPNGVFGIKIHYAHVREFGGFARLKAFFPGAHYILLTREDALKQAVSHEIAAQTGVWISGQKPHDEARYDREKIDMRLRQVIRDNAAWRYVLAANGCHHMHMNYSDVASDLPGAVREVARFAGVEVPAERIPVQSITQRQERSINAEWVKRYLEEGCPWELGNKSAAVAGVRLGVGKLKRFVQRRLAASKLKSSAAALLLAFLGMSASFFDPAEDGKTGLAEEIAWLER